MVWQWFNFSWTESIKKRACRAFLNRYLGKYLDQRLELEGMTIDLANGCCSVENVKLSAEALNSALDEACAPVHVQRGVIGEVSVSIPWMSLLKENCTVEIRGIALEVEFKPPCSAGVPGVSLTDSLLVSNEQASLDIATEVASRGAGLPKEDSPAFDDNYGGVDALARAIQHILDRVKVSIMDTTVTVSHLSGDRQRELALRLFLHKIEFYDAITEKEDEEEEAEAPAEGSEVQGQGQRAWNQHRPFATKILHLIDPFVEFAQHHYHLASSEELTTRFQGIAATPVLPFHLRHETAPAHRRWSPFAMATGEVEVKLKVKQQDAVGGHKLQLEGFCGALHVLVSPQQLHGLVQMATEIASTVMSPGLRPSPAVSETAHTRSIRPHEFARMETQLHHQMMEDQGRVMDPFQHPLDEEDPLNHSLSDMASEDTFYSIELSASHNLGHSYGDLPPLGAAVTESTSNKTSPQSIRMKECPMPARLGSSSSSATPNSHFGHGSQQSALGHEDDSVSYSVTVNVLTVSLLQCDSIGLLRQDSTTGSVDGSEPSSGAPSGVDGGASSFETNEGLRQRYLKGLSAVCSRAGKGAKMEDLGGAVPTDHLLMWLSTVKWSVSSVEGKVDLDTTIGRAKLLEFLFGDTVGSLSLSHLTKPISCSKVLCLSGSGADVSPSLVPSRPCCKISYSADSTGATKKGRSGHPRSKSARATLEVSLGVAEFELDVSLVDRLESLLAPHTADCGSSPLPASMDHNYTSLYLGQGSGLSTIHQKRQEVFQRNLDDFSQPLSVNLCVKCQQLKLSVRFPMLSAPDAAPHPHLPWVQYWKEKLLFQVSPLSLRSTLGQNSTTALSWCFQCERLTGALISDGCPNGEQFLCVSGPEEEDGEEETGEEVENGPEVTITWTPPPTLPPDQHMPTVHSELSTTRSLGDSILDAMEQMRGVPGSTPFSTGCTKHVTGVSSNSAGAESEALFGDKVLPGSAQELRDFGQEAIRKSACRVTCSLPYLLLAFPRKDVFDTIYCRLVGDMMQWESQPVSLEPSGSSAAHRFNPLAPPHVPTIPPLSDSYAGSAEVFRPFTALEEEDALDEVHASLGQETALPRDNLSVCQFSVHIMVANSQVAIATDNAPLPECPPWPGEEEKLIEVESSQSGQQQQAVLQHPLHFNCSDIDVFYCHYASSPVQHLAVQVQAVEVRQAEEVVLQPAKQGYRLKEPKNEEPFLTVAMERRISSQLNTQHNKWAVLLCGATAGLVASRKSWVGDLAHFLTIPASTTVQTADPHSQTTVNLVHLNVIECTVEYRPLHLPLVAVLWLEESTVSTSLVTNSPVFTFRVLLDTCRLFLSDHPLSVEPLHSGAVCVAEAGPLDLLLTMRRKATAGSGDDKRPGLGIEFSGGQVHLMTCADSFVALRDIILYLAVDGDSQHSGCSEDAESRQQTTPPSSLSSSAPVASLQMNVTDYLKEAMTEDSVGSSPSKQKSTSRRAGHVARTPSAGIHVEFASDSESEPGNSLDERTVDAGLHQSGTTESSETNHIPCHMSPTMISPVFADEQEEGGFLLYDPLHTLSTDSELATPVIRCLLPEEETLIANDNYFTKPGGYVDRLQRPRSYPQPFISYTIKELNVLWQAFGGHDLSTYLPPVTRQQSAHSKADKKGKHLGSRPQNWWGKGGVSRDHSTVVELELTKLRVQYEEYPVGAAQSSRLALLIQDVEIRDCLSVSSINKLLYQFCSDDMPRQTHANMVMFKAVFMASERETMSHQEEGIIDQDASNAERVLLDSLGHQKEGVVRLSLLPVRVNLDQDTMFFLQDFFLDISLAPPPSCLQVAPGLDPEVLAGKEAPGALYIKSFTFSPDVTVCVDYVAKYIDMDKGKVAGVLGGLSHLNCLQLSLKSLHTSQGFTSWGELARFAAHHWQVDITQYQIPRMIRSVGPLHYITQFVHGVVDLVWLPWQQYQEDGRMFRGLQRGANSFTSSTGSASLELASRLVGAVEGIVRFASSMTGDELTPARQRPQGMYEGFTTAYGVVSEGVTGTVANVAQVVYDEHQSRGVAAAVGGVVRLVPRMVLRPIIHVSEATRLALTGMRNELVPSARKEDNAKYKPPEPS